MSRLLPLATALLCAALAPLVACTNDTAPAKEIIGTWEVDTDAMWEAIKSSIPTEKQEKAQQFLVPVFAQMRLVITITADKVLSTAPDGGTAASTYQVEKIEGDAVTIAWGKEGNAESSIRMTLTVAGDRATLVSAADPGRTIPMKRLAAAAVAPAAAVTPAPAPAQP
jgi:hypothetical protein